jgi:hypothetical protein
MNIQGKIRPDDGRRATREPLLARTSLTSHQLLETAADSIFEPSREMQDRDHDTWNINEIPGWWLKLGMALLIASPVYNLVVMQLCVPQHASNQPAPDIYVI